jgi:hypothetical protein
VLLLGFVAKLCDSAEDELNVLQKAVHGQPGESNGQCFEGPVVGMGYMSNGSVDGRSTHAMRTSPSTDNVRVTACGFSSWSTSMMALAIVACSLDANGICRALSFVSWNETDGGVSHIVCHEESSMTKIDGSRSSR